MNNQIPAASVGQIQTSNVTGNDQPPQDHRNTKTIQSNQVRALFRKTLSYQKRQHYVNCCCVVYYFLVTKDCVHS
jgi:hypothetical protein